MGTSFSIVMFREVIICLSMMVDANEKKNVTFVIVDSAAFELLE